MKKILIVLLTVMMLLPTAACKKKPDVDPVTPVDPVETDVQKEFAALQKKWFIEDVSSDYSNMRFSVENPEAMGIKDVEVTLGEIEDPEAGDRYAARLEELKKFNPADLTTDQQNMLKCMEFYFDLMVDNYALEEDYTFLFTPNSGVNNNLITTFTEMDIRNEQDIKDIITLLNDSDRYIQLCIDYTNEQAEKGIIQPDFVIDSVVEGCEKFVANVDNNEVIKIVNAKIDKINVAGADGYKKQVEEAVKTVLIPAFNKIIAMYEPLKGKSVTNGRLCEYGDLGDRTYDVIVRLKTSSTQSIPDMIELMDDAIFECLQGIYDVMNEVEITDGYGYSDPREILEYLKSKMPADFPAFENLPYEVDFLDPSVTSPNISAYYLIAPVDNPKRNVIKVNPAFSDADPDGMCITLAHEGYPGHLYQNTYYLINHPDNEYRYSMSFTGYSEGWAQYVETYCYSYFLKNQKEIRYLQLNNIFSYCLYALADLEMHYNGWGKEDIENYLKQFFYEDAAKSYAESIYESNIGDPGMFLPYSVGLWKMWSLYQNAQKELGRKFNLKEYNRVILDAGECTFEMLEEKVNEFINKNK